MASYIIRDIDRELWQRAKAKAAKQIPNASLKAVIEALLATWLSNAPSHHYRGFGVYPDLDGWWAETHGGTCLGPFDSEADMQHAVDRDVAENPDHGQS